LIRTAVNPAFLKGVKIEAKKFTSTIIAEPSDMSEGKRMQLEDQIMRRALEVWRKKVRGRQDALNAWLQAEREIWEKTD
jgi:hypothetical protein